MLAHEEMTARMTTKTTQIDMVRAVIESVAVAADAAEREVEVVSLVIASGEDVEHKV